MKRAKIHRLAADAPHNSGSSKTIEKPMAKGRRMPEMLVSAVLLARRLMQDMSTFMPAVKTKQSRPK
jgi:hypothetical protein